MYSRIHYGKAAATPNGCKDCIGIPPPIRRPRRRLCLRTRERRTNRLGNLLRLTILYNTSKKYKILNKITFILKQVFNKCNTQITTRTHIFSVLNTLKNYTSISKSFLLTTFEFRVVVTGHNCQNKIHNIHSSVSQQPNDCQASYP